MKPLTTQAVSSRTGPQKGASPRINAERHGLSSPLALLPIAVLHIESEGEISGLNEEGHQLIETLLEAGATPCTDQLRALAENVDITGETVIQAISWLKGGQTHWLEATVIPTDLESSFIIARDSTLEVNMRLALVDSRQRFKDLVEISSDFAWETDSDGVSVFVSPSGALEYPAQTIVGMKARDLLYQPSVQAGDVIFETQAVVDKTELWLKNAEGIAACVLASAIPISAKNGQRTGARGVCRDITADRLRENDLARLKVREQVITYVVDAVRNEARPTDMLSTAVTSIGKAMTDTACAVYQRDVQDGLNLVAHYGALSKSQDLVEAIGRVCTDFDLHEDFIDNQNILMTATQYRNDMNGAVLLCRPPGAEWSSHDQSLLSAVAGQLGIALQQITDQEELERLSRTDALTGLFNRRAFMEELGRAILGSRRHGFQSAMFFVDLDNFKTVNDTHGHDIGNHVLSKLSEILRGAARSYDFVARLGGDEFALWFENIDKYTARRRAQEIIRSCKSLDQFSGATGERLGLSIGIAMDTPQSVESSDGLLKRADAAMYRAKHSRKNNISIARNNGPRQIEP